MGEIPPSEGTSVTRSLRDWKDGDPGGAGQVIASLYDELHRIAARMLGAERREHTLQPTALISELYLRLNAASPPDWRGRTHFFAVAANTLRRILIDHARAHTAERRGAAKLQFHSMRPIHWPRVPMTIFLLSMRRSRSLRNPIRGLLSSRSYAFSADFRRAKLPRS